MKIYIASHRHLDLPNDNLYQPLFVGACKLGPDERKPEWKYDDTYKGNISHKNSSYCELTGLHWIWKQSPEDVIGLVHYRRYFASPNTQEMPISRDDIKAILATYDCIIPQRIPCMTDRGHLVSIAEQFRTFHPGTDFTQLASVLRKYHPSYYKPFLDFTREEVSFAPYNMMICSKSLLDEYASWLFDVEKKLGKRISPLNQRSAYQQRVYGFLSERLLNVYLYKNGLKCYECPVYDPSGTASDFYTPLDKCPKKCPRFKGALPEPIRNGVDFSPIYSTSFYLSHYSDLYDAFFDMPEIALDHFLTCGLEEGRIAHPCFSITSYINGNPQIWEAVGQSRLEMALHYIKHRAIAKRAIGFENGFYEIEGGAASHNQIKLSELKREYYLRIAEHVGLID